MMKAGFKACIWIGVLVTFIFDYEMIQIRIRKFSNTSKIPFRPNPNLLSLFLLWPRSNN